MTTENKSLIIITLIFIIFALFILNSNKYMLTNYISDDAYYYYLPAKNFVQGLGFTFDKTNFTNGFHWLYFLICIPVFLFLGNYLFIPLKIIFLLNFIFYYFSGILLLKINKKITNKNKYNILILTAWLFNPLSIQIILLGLESSINIFLLLSLYYILLLKKNNLIIYISILLFLIRTDNIFYILLTFILFYKNIINKKKIFLFIMVLILFFIFNYINTNHFFQTSGLAKKLFHNNININASHIFYNNLINPFQSFYIINFFNKNIFYTLIFLMFFIFLSTKRKINNLFIIAFIIQTLTFLLYYKYYSLWYSSGLIIIFYISLIFIIKKINIPIFINIFCSLLILLSFFILWLNKIKKYDFKYNSIKIQEKTADFFKKNNIQNVNIGSFDSGLNGYYFDFFYNKFKIKIINLDGLANSNAYNAATNKTFLNYLKNQKINYLIEGLTLKQHINWLGKTQIELLFKHIKNRKNYYYDMVFSKIIY